MTEIIWEGTDDDLTAKVGEYVLRALQLGNRFSSGLWLITNNPYCLFWEPFDSLESAKAAAVKAYKEHINSK